MDISVEQCSHETAISMLNEPSVLKLLPGKFTSLSSDYVTLIMDGILLVVAKPHDDGLEIHIACKYRDRPSARKTIFNGLQWLKSRGFTTIWTTIPDSRKGLRNLLLSLGFEPINDRWVYGI